MSQNGAASNESSGRKRGGGVPAACARAAAPGAPAPRCECAARADLARESVLSRRKPRRSGFAPADEIARDGVSVCAGLGGRVDGGDGGMRFGSAGAACATRSGETGTSGGWCAAPCAGPSLRNGSLLWNVSGAWSMRMLWIEDRLYPGRSWSPGLGDAGCAGCARGRSSTTVAVVQSLPSCAACLSGS